MSGAFVLMSWTMVKVVGCGLRRQSQVVNRVSLSHRHAHQGNSGRRDKTMLLPKKK